jgi:hypothetical protein
LICTDLPADAGSWTCASRIREKPRHIHPDVFSGRFSRTLMHQDFSTSLRKKSLNSGKT